MKSDFTSQMSTHQWVCCIASMAFSLCCCLPAYAIDPDFGVGMNVGIPYEIMYDNGFYKNSSDLTKISQRNYTKPSISGSFDVSLPWNFALEVSAAYKRMNYHRTVEVTTIGGSQIPGYTVTKTTYETNIEGYAWELPLVLRHNLVTHRSLGVFAEGGFVARRSYTTNNESFNGATVFFPKKIEYKRRGFVAGLGVDIPVAPFHILTQMRYSRLLEPETYSLYEGGEITQSNSIEVLLGFRFRGKSGNPK